MKCLTGGKIFMEFSNSKITILRKDDEVALVFNDLGNLSVNLSDNEVEDVKELFNKVFEYIVSNEQLIKFVLQDGEEDLFHEVAEDIVLQLNAEIKQSEDNFEKIVELKN